MEDFPLEPDYRVPRDLKQDYWLYQRFARLAAAEYDGFVVGDSVVWGVYSKRPETLSHYLNKQAGGERFVNFGMIGCHPLALEGLIRHYASSISGKNVVLQCNLLWLKSPKEDYQEYDDKAPEAPETLFHIGLIPQFVPDVPRYRKQEISRRLSILVEQRLPSQPMGQSPAAGVLSPGVDSDLDHGAPLRRPGETVDARVCRRPTIRWKTCKSPGSRIPG